MALSISHLGTIDESGISDTGFSRPASHEFPESDEEEFIYPGASAAEPEVSVKEILPLPTPSATAQRHPSPAQLESLYAAASSGDLPQLQRLFSNALQSGDIEAFALSNDASSRTGFTPLHAAANRGYLSMVKWLVEHCGAIPDLEDKEGETAIHKAALNGNLSVLQYLLPDKADVHAKDADGWTALHNAASKGYLDVVRWLCEQGGAANEIDGKRGVDVGSKDGWTPLMNAASKGHLPVVLYLLLKQSANPSVRNNWGETAYDIAASVFEVWICEVLQKAEAAGWNSTDVPYNPLAVHTTLPLILYENQKLDYRLKTLAVSGGRPKFSASGLGRHGRRAPFEMKLPVPDQESGARTRSAWRSDVQLPLRENPWYLPVPASHDRPSLDGVERSHFWLSDWTLDVTHPAVDVQEGWQYAHSFDDSDDLWTSEPPSQLQRLLAGSIVSTGLGGSVSRTGSRGRTSSGSSSTSATSQTWVRRRRWVRVMRRRLDILPLPLLEPDGAMYRVAGDGSLIPYVPDTRSVNNGQEGQELGLVSSGMLLKDRDYVSHARYLVGNQSQDSVVNGSYSTLDARRAIAKLERATAELQHGILGDENFERKTQAEVLLNAYSRELDRRRQSAGIQGLLLVADSDEDADLDGNSSDEEFHYPGASSVVSTRRSSIMSSGPSDYFSRSNDSQTVADLTPQLSQAPEFRVPTHEAPQKVMTPRWTPPTPHQVLGQWERDETVLECRECRRRFSFLLRRHCRHCGRIFCDRCSAHRVVLDPSDVVQDPTFPEGAAVASSHRVCQTCYDEINATVPTGLQTSRIGTMERIVVEQSHLSVPAHLSRVQSSSQLSDLADCPVCAKNLQEVGSPDEQEAHVRNCLEGGSGASAQASRYIVYKLPHESLLIGVECVICLEEFVKGSEVARLSCLCTFHNSCLTSWMQRGRNCPVHAR